jgi:hypothetical protein
MFPVHSLPCLAFALASPGFSQATEPTFAPVAILECEVPDLNRFVVHGSVPLPEGFTFRRTPCPFTVFDRDDNPLVTQWEPIAYRADGTLMTVEILAQAVRGSMEPGSIQRFLVREVPSSYAPLDIDLDHPVFSNVHLRAVDSFGNEYRGDPEFVRIHRYGAVQVTAEWSMRLLPTDVDSPTNLEQLGAAQMWLSFRRDSNIIEVALNFHNASSQHPGWHLYFERLQLTIPELWGAVSMWPEPQAGEVFTFNGNIRVLPLIKRMPGPQMHFMEQRHERGFRYWLHPQGRLAKALELSERKGWAHAIDQVVNPTTGERTWSFHNADTSGYFPQGLPMPDLSHVDGLREGLISTKNALYNQISNAYSVGPGEAILLEDGFRNPYGVTYGGMTGGVNINPYQGMETLWSGQREGLLHAYAVMRCYNDRQPGAMYEDNGSSFDPTDPAYLDKDGTQPYRLYSNVFSTSYPNIVHDAPWNWHSQDPFHEQYVEANNLVPAYRNPLVNFAPIDTQHMWRYSRMIKMLVYLDNDPLARRRMEAACELLRATYYDGPEGRLRGFLNGPGEIGGGFGREHAAAGDFAAAAYAMGRTQWRARWKPWFETYADSMDHIQSPGGIWMALTHGKVATSEPLGDGHVAYFRSMRPNEHVYSMHALRGIQETVFGEDADPPRHARARQMIKLGGRAMWRMLWRWNEDLSGPNGNGLWDRVAVGQIGANPLMVRNHTHLPPQMWEPGLALDSYRTGLGLTYWLVEERPLTAEMVDSLVTYSGTTDFLGAAMSQGLNNIFNDCALLAFLQISAR